MYRVQLFLLFVYFISERAADAGPCDEVSCHFNADCEPSADGVTASCVCREEECFGAEIFEVCGSDGNTYNNSCEMMTESCKQQRKIVFKNFGKCGKESCSSTKRCRYNGICVMGTCECKQCEIFDMRRVYHELSRHSSTSEICGSDGNTYPSECHMERESCRIRRNIVAIKRGPCKVPRRRLTRPSEINHLHHWMSNFILSPKQKFSVRALNVMNRIIKKNGFCKTLDISGCVSPSFKRAKYLGLYELYKSNEYTNGPVYKKLKARYDEKVVYLSRYMSKRYANGSWIIGTKIGTGFGWMGVNDASPRPEFITSPWSATTGNKKKPWSVEPSIKARCINPPQVKLDQEVCNPGMEIGKYRANEDPNNTTNPIYKISVHGDVEKGKYYTPGKKIIVRLRTLHSTHRFRAAYVYVSNSEEQCNAPLLTKGRKRVTMMCDNKVILQKSAKGKKRVTFVFRAPPRGCITFRFFIKSKSGELYYDKRSNAPPRDNRAKFLTKTVCHKFIGIPV